MRFLPCASTMCSTMREIPDRFSIVIVGIDAGTGPIDAPGLSMKLLRLRAYSSFEMYDPKVAPESR